MLSGTQCIRDIGGSQEENFSFPGCREQKLEVRVNKLLEKNCFNFHIKIHKYGDVPEWRDQVFFHSGIRDLAKF